MKRLTLLLVALSLATAILVSCLGRWHAVETIHAVAWADDDARVALIVVRYEKKNAHGVINSTPEIRDARHQLYLQDASGGNRIAITDEIDGLPGDALYYMRGGRYFVISQEDDHARWYTRVFLDGTLTEIAREPLDSCVATFFDVVPSPDGTTLAQVRRAPGCAQPTPGAPPSPIGTTGDGQQIEVRFLAAAHLDLLDEPEVVTLSAWNVEWTWTPQGDFVVTDNSSAWSLAPGRAPMMAPVPGCMWPKTTSSAWSGDGVFIQPDGMSVAVGGTNPDAAFGCQ